MRQADNPDLDTIGPSTEVLGYSQQDGDYFTIGGAPNNATYHIYQLNVINVINVVEAK